MKIYNKIVESITPPKNENDIWLSNGVFHIYKQNEWQAFTLPLDAAEKVEDILKEASSVYQEKLQAGNGIIIENNTISATNLFQIIDTLPTTGKTDRIYLLYSDNAEEGNELIEYIWVNGKWELIGSFKINGDIDADFSKYLTKTDAEKTYQQKIQGKGLSTNDFTDRDREKLESLENYDDTAIKADLAKKADKTEIPTKLSQLEPDIEIGGGDSTTSSGKYQSNIEDGSIAMTEDYGDFKVGTTVGQLRGMTYNALFDGILFPTINPTFTAPSASIAWSGYASTQEVGATGPTANNFTTSYNAGAINLSGKKQANRGGEQDKTNSFIYVNGSADNRTLPSKVTLGNTTFKYRAVYAQGPQPKDNKGNDYDSPLAAGHVDSGQITLNGTYPWYASTQKAGELTKQALIAWNATAGAMQAGATNVGFEVQPHTASAPQKFKLPRKATSLQMYNTVAKAFETVSLSDWDETTSQDTINGNTCTYYTYTYKGDARGSVKLIVKF